MSTSITESNRRLPLHRRFALSMPKFVETAPGKHHAEEIGDHAIQAAELIVRLGGDLTAISVRRAR